MHKKIDLEQLSPEELVNEWSIREEELRIQNEQLIESGQQVADIAERFERVFLYIPLPVILLDSRGFVLDVNVAAQETFQRLAKTQRFLFSRILATDARGTLDEVLADKTETQTIVKELAASEPDGRFLATFIRMAQGEGTDFAVILQSLDG